MWTPSALASEARPFGDAVWRVVEAQHRVATVRLTDSLEEQAVLEELIEETKPAMPLECAGLDWLLATPFRYLPYPHGSRFRRARQREGAFYAAAGIETAFAEMAFYRILFFAQAPEAALPRTPSALTAFQAQVSTQVAIDLTEPPLDRDRPSWEHLTDYTNCQDLADAARHAGVEVILSRSVRDPSGGRNVTVLAPCAFAKSKSSGHQSWRMLLQPHGVRLWRDGPPSRQLEFPGAAYVCDPRLAFRN
jgi:hypothetical protein